MYCNALFENCNCKCDYCDQRDSCECALFDSMTDLKCYCKKTHSPKVIFLDTDLKFTNLHIL